MDMPRNPALYDSVAEPSPTIILRPRLGIYTNRQAYRYPVTVRVSGKNGTRLFFAWQRRNCNKQ